LFVLDLYEQQLKSVDLPSDWVPGRSAWDPAQNGLVTIARKRMNNPCPHCSDSETYLVYVDLNSWSVVPNLLTEPGLHITSPVFSPEGDMLLFLRNNVTDAQGVPVSGRVSLELVSYAWPPLNHNTEVLISAHQQYSNFHGIKRTSTDTAIFFTKDGDETVILVNSDDILGARGGSVLVYYPLSSSTHIMERSMKILDVADEMILAASINITDTQIFLGALVPELTTTTTIETTPQTTSTTEKVTTTDETTTASTTTAATTAATTPTPLPLTCKEILESYRNSESEESTASIPLESNVLLTTQDSISGITLEATEMQTTEMPTSEMLTTDMSTSEMPTTEQVPLTPSLSIVSCAGFDRIYYDHWTHIDYDSTQQTFRAINRKASNSLMVYLPTESNQQIKMELMKFWLTLGWDVFHLGYELGMSGSMDALVTGTQLVVNQISKEYERTVVVGEGLGGTLALLVADGNTNSNPLVNSNKIQQVVTLDAVMDLHSLIIYDRKLLARMLRERLPFIPSTVDIQTLWTNSPLSKLGNSTDSTVHTTTNSTGHSSTMTKDMSHFNKTDFLLFCSGIWPKQSETFYDLARKRTDNSILLNKQGSSAWFGSAGVWLYSASGEEQRRCRVVVSPEPPVTPRPTTEGASTTTSKSSTSGVTPSISLFLSLVLLFSR